MATTEHIEDESARTGARIVLPLQAGPGDSDLGPDHSTAPPVGQQRRDQSAGLQGHPLTCLVMHPSPMYRRGLCSVMAESGMRVQEVSGETALPQLEGADVLLTAATAGQQPPSVRGTSHGRDVDDVQVPVPVGLLPDASPEAYWDALALGWNSVVHRDAPVEDIIDVVRQAVRGRAVLPHEVLRAALEPGRQPLVQVPRRRHEIQMLRALGAGTTVAQLARQYGYSEREMYRRLHHLYERLGVSSRTDALIVASRRGLL